ncbi:hypothetical protein DA2_1228 [Desulfovibrio sp. A2]|nr:hypothetical protein DA2_1228 [Desulfovibrio sp. A2]
MALRADLPRAYAGSARLAVRHRAAKPHIYCCFNIYKKL